MDYFVVRDCDTRFMEILLMIEVVKITTTSAVHKFGYSVKFYHLLTERVSVQTVDRTATNITNMNMLRIITVFRHLIKDKTASKFINS